MVSLFTEIWHILSCYLIIASSSFSYWKPTTNSNVLLNQEIYDISITVLLLIQVLSGHEELVIIILKQQMSYVLFRFGVYYS
jgi:hypothetical protein